MQKSPPHQRRLATFVVAVVIAALSLIGLTAHSAPAVAAGGCTDTIPSDRLASVQLTNSDGGSELAAWEYVKVSLKLENLDGCSQGATMTVGVPDQITAQQVGTVVDLEAPDGSPIGTATIGDGSITIELTTDYAATHNDVHVEAYAYGQLDDSMAPGEDLNLDWPVNGTDSVRSTNPVATCDGCNVLPDEPDKWGQDNGDGTATVQLQLPQSTGEGEIWTWSDQLTNGGQTMVCPQDVEAASYTAANDWGTPQDLTDVPAGDIAVTECTDEMITGTIKAPDAGAVTIIYLTFKVSGDGPWKDTLTVTGPTGEQFPPVEAVVQRYGAGGGGDGDDDSSSSTSPSSSESSSTSPSSSSDSASPSPTSSSTATASSTSSTTSPSASSSANDSTTSSVTTSDATTGPAIITDGDNGGSHNSGTGILIGALLLLLGTAVAFTTKRLARK